MIVILFDITTTEESDKHATSGYIEYFKNLVDGHKLQIPDC